MKTRTKVLLSLAAIAVLAFVGLVGSGIFIVLKNLSVTQPTLSAATAQFEAIRRRFPERPPLIQADDPLRARIHVNRPPASAPPARLTGFEILVWKTDDQELLHTRAPLWMMRLSTINLLSQLGLAPGSVELTVDDVERYGPGVVIDYSAPSGDRVLVVVQ